MKLSSRSLFDEIKGQLLLLLHQIPLSLTEREAPADVVDKEVSWIFEMPKSLLIS
jgi:hypothetical protein